MNKQDLIAAVADQAGISKADAGKAVEAVFEGITSTLKSGGEVRLVGFGVTGLTESDPSRQLDLFDLPVETRTYVAALAPILGDAAPSDAPSLQPAPPPDWRNAPLFVQRPDGSRATITASSGAQSGDGRAAVPARDPAHAEPQDGSIFVATASDGGTP